MESSRPNMPKVDEAVIARITTEVPDSPAFTADDWALSSLGGVSDFEDDALASVSASGLATPQRAASSGEPSLIMPRMLTSRGRSSSPGASSPPTPVGKLRILLAGASGVGKSQFVDTLVAETGDIITSTRRKAGLLSEILVQTAPRARGSPFLAAVSTSLSRSSSPAPEDDYNVALLDITGYGKEGNSLGLNDPKTYAQLLSSHLDTKFQETAALLNGFNPGSHYVLAHASSLRQFPSVDCCLYFFDAAGTVSESDLVVLRELAPYVAIVPVLTRSDVVAPEDLAERKRTIASALAAAGIATVALDDAAPHAVSTRYEHNYYMDASTVEAPGYRSQVLVPSDLNELSGSLLSDIGARSLRYASARLFSSWVQSIHMRSTLHHRLSHPVVIPNQVHIDLGWELMPTSSDSHAKHSAEDPCGEVCNKCGLHNTPSRRKLSPINNVDPLDLGRWGNTLYGALAFVVAICGVRLASLYAKNFFTPPPPPPPPRMIDFVRGWMSWLRSVLVVA